MRMLCYRLNTRYEPPSPQILPVERYEARSTSDQLIKSRVIVDTKEARDVYQQYATD